MSETQGPAQIAYEAWVRSKEHPSMPETSPGQIAYEAFWHAWKVAFGTHGDDAWDTIHPGTRAAWEAAAQAVLALKQEHR